MARERTRFLAVVLVLAGLHTVLAAALPLSGDEAYYWDCSRHLDWAYFDQPPLVIWAMIPCRAVLGESRLAVRAPAILASLLTGLCLLPLVRRLGGGAREASQAYLLLHVMPLYFLGSFYASTDAALTAAWVAATWAAVALAQGERRAWWGFAVAVGLGLLAKFPMLLVLPALAPAVLGRGGRQPLRTATPYLAGALGAALTLPVWIWAALHDFDNIAFQLGRRLEPAAPTVRFLAEFALANLVLASPLFAVALILAWVRRWRGADPAWRSLLVAAAAPLTVFAVLALRSRVGAHWGAPGLVVAVVALAMTRFRGRRALIVVGATVGLALSAAALAVVLFPDPLLDAEWRYAGRPKRITTRKLKALVGDSELARRVAELRREGELVASESYTTVHLLGFLSGGALPTRLAHVKDGKHGLASLYWHRPDELRGSDVLFVTETRKVDQRLARLFAEVTEEEPLEVWRGGRVVRTVRLLRCRDLRHPEGVFTRLE